MTELSMATSRPTFRFRPLDFFILTNVILFILMCVFSYYALFVNYRGTTNAWEFFVYAAAILLTIALLWFFLRHHTFSAPLLVMVQIGILIHFAGAFIHLDGQRLYDCSFFGIRYDKYVHFTNAIIAALVLRHIFVLRGLKLDAANRVFILLGVLGLGAIIEIMEYFVCKTIPINGVGGYDNNMQDLIANVTGSFLCVATFNLPLRITSHKSERIFSVIEITVLLAGFFTVSYLLAPFVASSPQFALIGLLTIGAGLAYILYFSPALLHHDSLEERGLGTWRTLFIRMDNIRSAARSFSTLLLVGTIIVLILTATWNSDVFAHFNKEAFAVRLLFYSMSSIIQQLIFVGFFLVRFRKIFMPSSDGISKGDERRNRFLVSAMLAIIFSAIHFPNLPLMALTLFFGFAMAWISFRTPNLFVAAGCQLVLGMLLHRVLELPMRVGIFYDHSDIYFFRTIFPLSRHWIGGLY